jgi:protein-ribulosamine 3-kinase
MPGPARAYPAGACVLKLGADVLAAVAEVAGTAVTAHRAVSGGCISPAARVELADGRALFVKTAPSGAAPGLLESEAFSLERLRQSGAVRVPGIVAQGPHFLALEWLPPAPATERRWRELGAGLAALHRVRGAWGWERDNFIGTLPQENGGSASWPEFWVERRLGPQLRRASHLLDRDMLRGFDLLVDRAPEVLAAGDEDGPSLLHGDLWRGNVHMSAAGPALIDPSCSFGHREADLAMAELFGGFATGFRDAYEEAWPLLPEYASRRPTYQLYYLLVHVNLFGGGYVAQTAAVLGEALRRAG